MKTKKLDENIVLEIHINLASTLRQMIDYIVSQIDRKFIQKIVIQIFTDERANIITCNLD